LFNPIDACGNYPALFEKGLGFRFAHCVLQCKEMRLEHYSVEKLKKEILEILGRHIDLKTYKVFFFGSRVSSSGSDRSDIDIGIDGPKEVPSLAMAKICEEIENLPTLYKIDIVDFKNVSNKFKSVALKNIELINQ